MGVVFSPAHIGDVNWRFSGQYYIVRGIYGTKAEGTGVAKPLYEDPWFTVRFADDRLIPRFHLEGVKAGQRLSVFKIDPGTGERLGLLATATVGDRGRRRLRGPDRADFGAGGGGVRRCTRSNSGAVI